MDINYLYVIISMSSFYIFPPDKKQLILNKISNMEKTSEIEVSINQKQGISVNQYMELVSLLINLNEKTNISTTTTLDINYVYDELNYSVYRISIEGIDKINKIMSNLAIRKNHSIFSILVNNMLKRDTENMTIMNKIKSKENNIDILDYDIRFRVSKEMPVSKDIMNDLINLREIERHKITFRYKERLSVILNINADYDIRIDLTDVKDGKHINNLASNVSRYELEIELIKNESKEKKINSKLVEQTFEKILELMYQMHKLLHKSTKIITTHKSAEVLKFMKQTLYGNENNHAKDLPGMQSESLENQHVAGELTNNYTVTDKADGDREFMIIYDNHIYLISNNLFVREIDSSIFKNIQKYNGCIIDGEYVWSEKYNKYMYLAFDMLVYNNVDIRKDAILLNRLTKLNEVLTNVFNIKQHNIIQESDKFNLQEIKTKYNKLMLSSFEELNKKLASTDSVVIYGKLFFFPSGLYQSELYLYSISIWNSYVLDNNSNCPYILDGLIYTPINQIYTRDLTEIKYKIYKWKPSNKNSIDMYIQFEKNPDTLQLLNVYDNSIGVMIDENLEGSDLEEDLINNTVDYKIGDKIYRICNLYVGSTKSGVEQPVLFGRDNNLYNAYLYLQDGEVRDIEGNILQDNTVVEFAYQNNPTIEHPYRWIPLRTRHDKTESVIKYKRKYGNNEIVANKVWRSIINPFEFSDLALLADESTFIDHMKIVNARVSKDVIIAERRENIYYQLKTDLAMPMRNFHNFLKSNYIYTYCGKKLSILKGDAKYIGLNVLDIGCGRGGDIQKFYHSRVKSYVGIDPDAEGIYDPKDGAISRYQTFKRKMPNMPNYIFIIADGGAELNTTSQEKAIGKQSEINKETLTGIFGKDIHATKYEKFDIFNCQFMIHYLFKNDQMWDNFCSNINRYLKIDGYIIITTTDGKLLDKNFENNLITHYYTDNGKKKILFEYKKLYNEIDTKKTGLPIDFFNATYMAPNTYQTEYIVDPEFIISELDKKCGCKLLDSDSFENQFETYRNFFDNVAQFEAVQKTNDYLMKTKEFYNFDNEINKVSFELTKLNRYYIFQKLK